MPERQLGAALGVALAMLALVLLALAAAAVLRKAAREVAARRQRRQEALVRPLLLEFLADPEPDEAALEALRAAWSGPVESLARAFLGKLRGADRQRLVSLLDEFGVIDEARRATYSRRASRRAAAAELLGGTGLTRALPELARLLRDRRAEVRNTAARALGRIGDPGATPFLLAAVERPRPIPVSLASMSIIRLGRAAVPALCAGLGSPSREARGIAAEILGQLGAHDAADDLVAALGGDAEPAVRTRAASALGRIGVPRSADALLAALAGDAQREVRGAAATALGAVGGPSAIPALVAELARGDTATARPAAMALAALGPPGDEALRRIRAAAEAGAPHAMEALWRRDGETVA